MNHEYIICRCRSAGGTIREYKFVRNCNKNVNITLHEIIDEIQLGESTVEIRNAIEIIKFILGFIPVINCITDIYQLVDDVTQALSYDGKISGGE